MVEHRNGSSGRGDGEVEGVGVWGLRRGAESFTRDNGHEEAGEEECCWKGGEGTDVVFYIGLRVEVVALGEGAMGNCVVRVRVSLVQKLEREW